MKTRSLLSLASSYSPTTPTVVAAQVALETERTVVRNGLSKERDDLRQERHQYELEKREWREKHEHELQMLEDGKNNLKLSEIELDEKKLQLKRSESNIGLMKNELAQKRTMMMEEMEQEMVRNRQERTELERFKLELNMEKTSLGVDQKNMKVDMDRLTNLGLELRKQSQSLSEAQVRLFLFVDGCRVVVVVLLVVREL